MTTMTLAFSEEMRVFIETQTIVDGHDSPSEFLHALIREEQRRRAKSDLDGKLQAALQGGPATPMTRADWDRLEARVGERDRAEQGRS